jgi:uncharacterized protein YeaC (DUF1315 family)
MSAEMHVDEVLLWCLQQNYHADKMNAAVHCAPVRFSPITFRLYETLMDQWPKGADISQEMAEIGSHRGRYVEDPGR